MLENGGASNQDTNTSMPGKEPIVKRRRQGDDDQVANDTDMTNEAASLVDDRWAQ